MSVATGISPNDLLASDPAVYAAIKFILQEQAQSRKAMAPRRR